VKVGTFWLLTLENVRDKRNCILPQDLAGTTNSKKKSDFDADFFIVLHAPAIY
jgi:hypothetical protein